MGIDKTIEAFKQLPAEWGRSDFRYGYFTKKNGVYYQLTYEDLGFMQLRVDVKQNKKNEWGNTYQARILFGDEEVEYLSLHYIKEYGGI
jgi:hypothetical protein